jgi:hypothetical protein
MSDTLTAAWEWVEMELPEGWQIDSLSRRYDGWVAAARQPDLWPDPRLEKTGGTRHFLREGPAAKSPVEALDGLAEILSQISK